MAIMDAQSNESEVHRMWNLLNELSEALSENRQMSRHLHTLAGDIKTQAGHSQTGFVLRRFNLDKSKEEYDAELEKMNATMAAENRNLMDDNKQLSALIKEYEQTLETVMASFRSRANEVQQQELSLMREYERKLLIRESEDLLRSLSSSSSVSMSLGRLGKLLRRVMRSINGEDPGSHIFADIQTASADLPLSSLTGVPFELNTLDTNEGIPDLDKDNELTAAEWSLERECELARLEQENHYLRKLLEEHSGLQAASGATGSDGGLSELPKLTNIPIAQARRLHSQLGGREVGPFGIYKKFPEEG